MAKWLNTSGKPSLAVAICGRCGFKRAYSDLRPDPNYPGIRVCGSVEDGCLDAFDPYRLAPRSPENVALRWARPDVDISITGGVPPPLPPS
jgi:hypothetical protein